jgi:hypothetical protein
MSRPFVADRPQQYVMHAYFASAPEADQGQTNLLLSFAYGIATQPNALPTSGVADYATTYSESGLVFRADYAAKAITGTLPFYTNGPTLTSLLKDVTISADGTSFSGRVVPPDGSAEGTIQGLFMGPTGEEFAAMTVLKKGGISIFSGVRTP